MLLGARRGMCCHWDGRGWQQLQQQRPPLRLPSGRGAWACKDGKRAHNAVLVVLMVLSGCFGKVNSVEEVHEADSAHIGTKASYRVPTPKCITVLMVSDGI